MFSAKGSQRRACIVSSLYRRECIVHEITFLVTRNFPRDKVSNGTFLRPVSTSTLRCTPPARRFQLFLSVFFFIVILYLFLGSFRSSAVLLHPRGLYLLLACSSSRFVSMVHFSATFSIRLCSNREHSSDSETRD